MELYLLHLKHNPEDLAARKELRDYERKLKELRGSGGFRAKAKAKKIELQAQAIRVSERDPKKTMGQCEDLLRDDPDCALALLRLGAAAVTANYLPVAAWVLADALRLDPGNEEALRLLEEAGLS